jgi:integration host factor subunit beta
MTKSELITRLVARFPGLLAKDCSLVVDTILDALAATLANGDRIEIRGFGTFSVHHRSPRAARNPKTGTKVAVPGKAVPHFKAGKLFREMVSTSAKPKTSSRKPYRLDDLLAQVPPGMRFEEFDAGPAVGREVL